ncbi:MAG: ribbon-helix-helix protein, CopG family [Chloroflexota bacterium]|nr:MAG: ribbon-helix-helix protein, CopG family [Chloroflexota bacterium]
MRPKPARRRHALAETATAYGSATAPRGHVKLSISLPTDLLDQVRAAAADSGQSVSSVIAAALDQLVSAADQDQLDAAIAVQNEENLRWADAFVPLTSKLWADVEW